MRASSKKRASNDEENQTNEEQARNFPFTSPTDSMMSPASQMLLFNRDANVARAQDTTKASTTKKEVTKTRPPLFRRDNTSKELERLSHLNRSGKKKQAPAKSARKKKIKNADSITNHPIAALSPRPVNVIRR